MEDLVEELRPFAPDTTGFDGFTQQWFFEVVVPEYQFDEVTRIQEGDRWIVSGTVKNAGTGTALVEVAATTGEERFEKQTPEQATQGPATVTKGYREARTTLTLAGNQSSNFRIECPFEPKIVVCDPDAKVLQLRRKYALHRF